MAEVLSPLPTSGPAGYDTCGKTQDTLTKPLKRCARCGSQKYCSRECQKGHWSTHRKDCARLATNRASNGEPGSMTNPPHSDIENVATRSIELIEALAKDPGFNRADPNASSPMVLTHLFQFCTRTFTEFLVPLLPPSLFAELSCRIPIGSAPEEKRANLGPQMDKAERESGGEFKRDEWPAFESEKYSDAIMRNMTAALIVTDQEKRKAMFAGAQPDGWTFGEDVEGVARGIMGKE